MDPIKQAYKPFKNLMQWQVFESKINAFPERKKWKFVRSSLLYQRAMKCAKCDPNVSLSLLCSSAEVISLLGSNAGSKNNFKALYLQYCPVNKRNAPIDYYANCQPPATSAPFDIALEYIYKRFRCLYTHEGIGRLSNLKIHGVSITLGASLLDKFKKDCYSVDLLKILHWFLDITLSSLFAML